MSGNNDPHFALAVDNRRGSRRSGARRGGCTAVFFVVALLVAGAGVAFYTQSMNEESPHLEASSVEAMCEQIIPGMTEAELSEHFQGVPGESQLVYLYDEAQEPKSGANRLFRFRVRHDATWFVCDATLDTEGVVLSTTFESSSALQRPPVTHAQGS